MRKQSRQMGVPEAERGAAGPDALRHLRPCEAEPPFTVAPLAEADFIGIVPLGNLNPPPHTFPTDHIYFYVRRTDPANPASPPATVSVYAPGDAWVTEIDSSENLSAVPPYTDYRVRFSPCREVEIYYGHVQSLPEQLARKFAAAEGECDTYTTGGQTYRSCRKRMHVRVRAGEAVGTAGAGRQNALDVGAFDARIAPLAYANPARFHANSTGFDSFHVVCPVDYFAEPVRSTLRARFGYGARHRTAEPLCGEVEQDEPGTAQGIWFVAGTTETYPEDPHLALVHDNIDPTQPAFSVGQSLSRAGLPAESRLNPGVYIFAPEAAGQRNREFRDLAVDGQVYCYDTLQYHLGGIVLVQVTSAATLRIERQAAAGCGAGPWAFTSAYTDFVR